MKIKQRPSKGSGRKSYTKKPVKMKSFVSTDFPIAGMGGSAGALEVFKELLSLMPIDTGMAFVIIQHLDPRHESMSSDILARTTKMPVQEIKDGDKLKPNHVFVIPPNYYLDLTQGILRLLPRTKSRGGQHLPLDFFLQALAREQKDKAIGVVLSGIASDGTQGLAAIKAEGGITIVQSPETAKYDGMPRSAISSGCVDLILEPKKIVDELVRIARHPYVIPKSTKTKSLHPKSKDEAYLKIFSILRNHYNTDFTHYKRGTICRRIERRMLVQKSEDLGQYADFLEKHPDEIKALYADILIHVTSFFRDSTVFETLKNRILPKYMKNRDKSLPFRVWVPGCSTGEEAYSLAMTIMEFLDETPSSMFRTPFSIFATDISEQALQKARTGIYPASITKDVSKKRLQHFFECIEGGDYKIAKWIRETCVFSRHDITRDPPFAKIDLISCRNILIYFDSELQKQIIPTLHYALNPSGILLLGRSETLNAFSDLFSPLDKLNKAYSRINISTPPKLQYHASRFPITKLEPEDKLHKTLPSHLDIQRQAQQIILSKYAPPSVVVNDVLNIVQTMGRISPFLEIPSGQFSPNLLKMAHPELIADLQMALQTAQKRGESVTRDGVFLNNRGRIRNLSIHVDPLTVLPNSKERYFTVFFEEAKENNVADKRGSRQDKQHLDMQKKLFASQEYQQSLIEQYETSQEELVSSNEELQSTNEELQSTNEELETAKEELQASNEELTTINDEIVNRNAEIVQVNNDLTNLLTSVDIPIVMVSLEARIRRFTPKAEKVLNLIPSDIGRPISDLKPNIEGIDLAKLVTEVMKSNIVKEIEIQDNNNHWHGLQIRPYTSAKNKTDGAVVVLQDINQLKNNEFELKTAAAEADTIIQAQPVPLIVLNSQLHVRLANKAFCDKFKVSRADTEGRKVNELGDGQWNIPELLKKLKEILSLDIPVTSFEVEHEFPVIGQKMMILNAGKVRLAGSSEYSILLSIEDHTDRIRAERARAESEEKYRNLVDHALDGIIMVDENGIIQYANRQSEKIFGYLSNELINKPVEILIPDRQKHIHIDHRKKFIAHPVARQMGSSVDLFAKRKDGTEVPVDVSLNPVKSQKGLYLIATIRDISERKEIEKERANILVREQEARLTAEKANLAKDTFLAMLSHELRTPLTAILSWSQMLRSGKLDADKITRGHEVIEQSAKAQSQLIDDLLDISRIQAGKLSLTIQETDPSKVISLAIESTRSLASVKSIQIEMAIDPSINRIYVDPTRFQQILWNLITNAIKFSSNGGRIWIKLDRIKSITGELICIQVRDNGKGIRPEFLPFIFERFTQVDTSSTRTYGGLGLGLAIVKNLVELHKGTITALSEGEGKGTTFNISLPMEAPTKISEAEAEAETEAEAEAEVSLRGLRVLIVDDEASVREIFSFMLEPFGIEVKTADSVNQALRVLQEFKPDVLVSDIAMPGEDGYSLIGKLRAMKSELGQIPALALTAYASNEDIQRTHLAGFQSHMAKPIDVKKLVLAIARLTRRK